MPAEIAAGPDPRIWCAERCPDRPYRGAVVAWRNAGEACSRAHGLGPLGWRELLPEPVQYATSSLGRAHIWNGGYRPPWDRTESYIRTVHCGHFGAHTGHRRLRNNG